MAAWTSAPPKERRAPCTGPAVGTACCGEPVAAGGSTAQWRGQPNSVKSPLSEYNKPFRRNHEAIAAGGWLTGAVCALLTARSADLPQSPFLWMVGVSATMTAVRGAAAWRLWSEKRRLSGRGLTFISMRDLLAKMRGHAAHLWLGYGFEWDQRHTQKVHEILKSDKASILPSQEGLGWRWMHGLEKKETDIYQALEDTAGHMLVVGTTGSGKTRTMDLLVAQAVARGEAVFIIDPKGDKDLRDAAKKACERLGAPERFVFFHPGFPEESARINPLQNFSRPTELATRIAELIPSETGADPFKAFAQMALNNIVQGLITTGEHPTLVSIRRHLESGPDQLVINAVSAHCDAKMPNWRQLASPYREKARDRRQLATAMAKFYFEEVQGVSPSSDLEGLLSMHQHDRDHFSRMVASLFPVLNMLTSGKIGELLSPDEKAVDDARPITDSGKIIKGGDVAYIGLDSLSDSMVGSAIGSIMLSDLAAVAGERYNYGVGLRPVNVFIDEAAEVINDRFIQILNKGRGAKMRLIVATQTFADFAARTGSTHKARQVLGNINNVIALRVLDAETQKYIVDGLPKTRVRYVLQSQSNSLSSDEPTMFSGGSDQRLMEEEADLFPAPLLGNLPNLEFVAKLSGGRLWKGRVPILKNED